MSAQNSRLRNFGLTVFRSPIFKTLPTVIGAKWIGYGKVTKCRRIGQIREKA